MSATALSLSMLLESIFGLHVLAHPICFGFNRLYSLDSLSTANTCRGETDLGMNPVYKNEYTGLQDLTPLSTQTQNLSQWHVTEPSTDYGLLLH